MAGKGGVEIGAGIGDTFDRWAYRRGPTSGDLRRNRRPGKSGAIAVEGRDICQNTILSANRKGREA